MDNVDYLNLKTTNINIRISPILKSQLIERGAKMSVNLSDYIGYVLTKEMSGQNDPKQSVEYLELETQAKRIQAELMRFRNLLKPYEESLNKDVIIDGKIHRFEHVADILSHILNSFKLRK